MRPVIKPRVGLLRARWTASLVFGALVVSLVSPPTVAQGASQKCHGEQATIVGTDGADEIRGTDRADVIVAGAGDDRVNALDGNDRVCGGKGNDSLRGRRQADVLYGGVGSDYLDGDRDRDTAYAHRGFDECVQVEIYYACNKVKR